MRDLPADTPPLTIGFPTPETVMVSKTDYAQMIAFVQALRDWAEDAQDCMKATVHP